MCARCMDGLYKTHLTWCMLVGGGGEVTKLGGTLQVCEGCRTRVRYKTRW